MKLHKNWKLNFTQDSASFEASISPCSWMYPHHGLQVSIKMKGGGYVVAHSTKAFEDAKEKDAVNLTKVKLVACKRCLGEAFDPVFHKTNRDGLCEKCWMNDWNKSAAKLLAKEAMKDAKLDAKQKKAGYKYRTIIWIHPQRGDDYMLRKYSRRPLSKADIKATCAAHHSRQDDDWTPSERL